MCGFVVMHSFFSHHPQSCPPTPVKTKKHLKHPSFDILQTQHRAKKKKKKHPQESQALCYSSIILDVIQLV